MFTSNIGLLRLKTQQHILMKEFDVPRIAFKRKSSWKIVSMPAARYDERWDIVNSVLNFKTSLAIAPNYKFTSYNTNLRLRFEVYGLRRPSIAVTYVVPVACWDLVENSVTFSSRFIVQYIVERLRNCQTISWYRLTNKIDILLHFQTPCITQYIIHNEKYTCSAT